MEIMFSVVVPVYRAEGYLERCIDSIIGQTYSDFELLLVDDMSPDRCPEICDRYAETDPRIKVFHQRVGGAVAARNVGTKHACGKYVCYVDADDWVDGSYFETLLKYITNYGEPDIISFNVIYSKPDLVFRKGDDISGYYDRKRMEREVYPFMIYDPSRSCIKGVNGKIYPAPWNRIYKSELLHGIYGSDERLTILEDNPYAFQHIYEAETLYFCDEYLYYYNKCNDVSVTSRYISDYLEKVQLVCQYMDKHLAGREPSFERQINVYKTAGLIAAFFHEVRYCTDKKAILPNIRKMAGESPLVKECRLRHLPFLYKVYLLLVRVHCYRLIVFLSRIKIKIAG